MIFAEIEQAIADRLSPLRDSGGIATRAMPNKPAEWGKSENGIITLKWERDEAEPSISMGDFRQRIFMQWKLDIRLKSLRDVSGAWKILEGITQRLLGFRPPQCDKIYIKSREFLGELEGVWVFEVVFIVPTWIQETL